MVSGVSYLVIAAEAGLRGGFAQQLPAAAQCRRRHVEKWERGQIQAVLGDVYRIYTYKYIIHIHIYIYIYLILDIYIYI